MLSLMRRGFMLAVLLLGTYSRAGFSAETISEIRQAQERFKEREMRMQSESAEGAPRASMPPMTSDKHEDRSTSSSSSSSFKPPRCERPASSSLIAWDDDLSERWHDELPPEVSDGIYPFLRLGKVLSKSVYQKQHAAQSLAILAKQESGSKGTNLCNFLSVIITSRPPPIRPPQGNREYFLRLVSIFETRCAIPISRCSRSLVAESALVAVGYLGRGKGRMVGEGLSADHSVIHTVLSELQESLREMALNDSEESSLHLSRFLERRSERTCARGYLTTKTLLNVLGAIGKVGDAVIVGGVRDALVELQRIWQIRPRDQFMSRADYVEGNYICEMSSALEAVQQLVDKRDDVIVEWVGRIAEQAEAHGGDVVRSLVPVLIKTLGDLGAQVRQRAKISTGRHNHDIDCRSVYFRDSE